MCTGFDKIDQIDLNKPLSSAFTDYKGIHIFEDPMHLVKCYRYRLVCGSDICSSKGRYDLLIALLPCFLLINSIMENNFTREQRLE